MGRSLKTKEQIVKFDAAVRSETVAHGSKVDGAMMLVDLDGIAPAERNVRTALACKMGEEAFTADGTAGPGVCG